MMQAHLTSVRSSVGNVRSDRALSEGYHFSNRLFAQHNQVQLPLKPESCTLSPVLEAAATIVGGTGSLDLLLGGLVRAKVESADKTGLDSTE